MAITDLTGYTWVGNETVNVNIVNYQIYSINFTSNQTSFTYFVYEDIGLPKHPDIYIRYEESDEATAVLAMSSGGWISDVYRTIQITGGTDATNPDLIAWFEDNGTLTKSGGSNIISIKYNSTEIYSGEETTPVNITYNGSVIATLNEAGTKTLRCANLLMLSDVIIGSKTLSCSGKIMSGDITVELTGDSWEYPVQTDDALLITQAYRISQDGSTIILDDEPAPTPTYTVSISGSHVTTTGGGTYEQGQSCTITATPASGYQFTNWTINGTTQSANPYTFTVTGNTTIVANTSAIPQNHIQ